MRSAMTILAVMLSGAFLSACEGSIARDAMEGPQRLAAKDDAYCRSLGVTPGSNAYVQCRLYQDQLRANRHAAGMAMVAQGANIASQGYQPAPSVSCRSNRFGNSVYTNCY